MNKSEKMRKARAGLLLVLRYLRAGFVKNVPINLIAAVAIVKVNRRNPLGMGIADIRPVIVTDYVATARRVSPFVEGAAIVTC